MTHCNIGSEIRSFRCQIIIALHVCKDAAAAPSASSQPYADRYCRSRASGPCSTLSPVWRQLASLASLVLNPSLSSSILSCSQSVWMCAHAANYGCTSCLQRLPGQGPGVGRPSCQACAQLPSLRSAAKPALLLSPPHTLTKPALQGRTWAAWSWDRACTSPPAAGSRRPPWSPLPQS